MKKHTKIYLEAFNIPPDQSVYVPCEIGKTEFNNCTNRATDIHHIDSRGMGGTSKEDVIENLMALCRNCHNEYGDVKDIKEMLYKIHEKRLIAANINYDKNYFK